MRTELQYLMQTEMSIDRSSNKKCVSALCFFPDIFPILGLCVWNWCPPGAEAY